MRVPDVPPAGDDRLGGEGVIVNGYRRGGGNTVTDTYNESGRCCETCKNCLGYRCCRVNLEAECGEGEFEAWEAREDEVEQD